MSWTQLRGGTYRHRKVRRLSLAIGCSDMEARGLLLSLWSWAIDAEPGGDLTGHTAEDLAYTLDWQGDAVRMLSGLLSAGILDRDQDTGRLTIHNWGEYNVGYREAERSRVRRASKSASMGAAAPDVEAATRSRPGRDQVVSGRDQDASGRDPVKAGHDLVIGEDRRGEDRTGEDRTGDLYREPPLLRSTASMSAPTEAHTAKKRKVKDSGPSGPELAWLSEVVAAWNTHRGARPAADEPGPRCARRDARLLTFRTRFPDPAEWGDASRALAADDWHGRRWVDSSNRLLSTLGWLLQDTKGSVELWHERGRAGRRDGWRVHEEPGPAYLSESDKLRRDVLEMQRAEDVARDYAPTQGTLVPFTGGRR